MHTCDVKLVTFVEIQLSLLLLKMNLIKCENLMWCVGVPTHSHGQQERCENIDLLCAFHLGVTICMLTPWVEPWYCLF